MERPTSALSSSSRRSQPSQSDEYKHFKRQSTLLRPSSYERIAVQSEVANDSLLRILSVPDADLSNKIILAAETGDLSTIRSALMNGGYDLTKCRGMTDYTCLHYASSRGHLSIIQCLLQASFPVNILNDLKETPLHLAVYNGNIVAVEQLLDYGADIDSANEYGETPLFYAVRRNMPAIARLLLQRGADATMKDSIGEKAIDQTDDLRMKSLFDASPSKTTNSPASTIPNHLLRVVFSYLRPGEVGKAAVVCGKWHRVSESPEIWQAFGIRRWELSLHSSLGFSLPASESFKRSSFDRSFR